MLVVARHVDCRKLESEAGQDLDERQFAATWECCTLAGPGGTIVDVIRRREATRNPCPCDVLLDEWAKTLRTKLFSEW